MLLIRRTALLFAFATSLFAQPASRSYDLGDISRFIEGEYVLIGRKSESEATYTGRVVFRATGDGLEFTRVVAGQTQNGNVVFDAKVDESGRPVLRVHFLMGGKKYEATYLWHSDPSNFARLTGYVYLHDGKTKLPGLEALFPLADYKRNLGD